jgi:hypothetical protein
VAFLQDLSISEVNFSAPPWSSATLITPSNAVKDHLSKEFCKRDACANKAKIISWTARYTHNNKPARGGKAGLKASGVGPHNITFTPNMPVMYLSNRVGNTPSVVMGIANGTLGQILDIVVQPQDEQRMHKDDFNGKISLPIGTYLYVPAQFAPDRKVARPRSTPTRSHQRSDEKPSVLRHPSQATLRERVHL